jgi:HSP20 family protein
LKNPLQSWESQWGAPFKELARIQSDFERAMKEMMAGRPLAANSFNKTTHGTAFSPSCEISEDKTAYLIKFDMPGINKDQVKIELDKNTLTVSAERSEEKKSDDKKTHYSEFFYGSYNRSFTLPETIDEKKIDATFANGVLSITLPKTEKSEPKRISVQ